MLKIKIVRLLLLVTFLAIRPNSSYSQDSAVKGKAIYTVQRTVKGKTYKNSLTFLFSKDRYVQYYSNAAKNSNSILINELVNRKQNKMGDSLIYNKIIDSLKNHEKTEKNDQYFGTLANNKIINPWTEPYTGKTYCVLDSITPMKWVLDNDTQTISGLACQKAHAAQNGNIYNAWFAPAIPVSVAPFQLRGLPGLIVKLENLTQKTDVILQELEWPYHLNQNLEGCKTENYISKEEKQKIFDKENAKVRNLVNELDKAYNRNKNKQ